MQKWEYLVLETIQKFELDELGRDGWEAVGVGSTEDGAPFVLFKRPVEAKSGRFAAF